MRLSLFATALIGLVIACGIARAQDTTIYECSLVLKDDKVDDLFKDKVPGCIKAQQEAIKQLSSAVDSAWKVAANPFELVRIAPLEQFRSADRFGVRANEVYETIGEMLRPHTSCYSSDCFAQLRARFADPIPLEGFWEANKSMIVLAAKAASIVGAVGHDLDETMPVFARPFDVALAASVGRWYGHGCWHTELESDDAKACKELIWIGEKFSQAYGADLTPNRAWMLGFLYRRHLEGGDKLVVEYQKIAGELGKELGLDQK